MRDLRITDQKTRSVTSIPIGIENYDKHKLFIARIAGSEYQFTPELKDVWNKLFLYFIGDPDVEQYGISLNKSIALTGTWGVSKTKTFTIIHRWLEAMQFRNPNSFRITCTEDIINLMQKPDWVNDVLVMNPRENSYGHGVPVPSPVHILINEFAYQYDVKSFGTNIKEFIEMFMMKRYDIFQQYGKLTHVTMNYGTDELKANFSPRLYDRFREMFNIIKVEGTSFRK